MVQPTKSGMPGLFQYAVGAMGLFMGLLPALGYAQTNIDQGKSPAEIFSQDCATCHKSARGLANGRGSSGLASFLVEHYTASKDQAAALAAYVMGAGGGDAVPATQRAAKPTTDRGRAAVEEVKPGAQPTRQSGKPEEKPPATARLQPPAGEEPKRSGDVPRIMQEPGGGRKPATATRGRPQEPAAAPSPAPELAPAATAAAPSPVSSETGPTSAPTPPAPGNADSGESSPVPRDDIPD